MITFSNRAVADLFLLSIHVKYWRREYSIVYILQNVIKYFPFLNLQISQGDIFNLLVGNWALLGAK